MKIAITGHRPSKLGNDYDLTSPLVLKIKNTLQELIDPNKDKITHLISGMALGIDTLWAKLALENNIPLIAAIPFIGQHGKWSHDDQLHYFEILSRADQIYIVDRKEYIQFGSFVELNSQIPKGEYAPAKMQLRNQWMVDQCDMLFVVWDKTKGGTANCLAYALYIGMGKNENIVHINPATPDKYSIIKSM